MTNGERVPSAWIPVLLAILANSWVLAMPFQADDYLILPEVGALLLIEQQAKSLDPRPDAHIGNFYLFRPVPWFLWWLLIKARGGFADPIVFHAAALACHAAATFLLWLVLRPIFRPFAATIGASAFAIAPGALQATSYVAAGGDQLAVLFMLLAARCLQMDRLKPSFARAGAAAVCAALAFCSKDVAIASLPAVFLAAWAVPSPAGARMGRPILLVVLMVAAAIAVRGLYLKTLLPAYLGAPQISAKSLGALDDLLVEFLMPWRRCSGIEDLAPLSARIAVKSRLDPQRGLDIAAAVFFGLPILLGILLSPLRVGRRIVSIAIVLAFVLTPGLVIFREYSTAVVSRALYPAAALCSSVLAAGIVPLSAPRGRRWLAIPLLLPLALLWADLAVHVARTELRAGRMVEARLESMNDVVSGLPATARVLAVDPEFELGCIPLIYFGIGNAMRPPFTRTTAANVIWWGDLSTVPRSSILQDDPGPIVIARLSEGRYVERHPRIPELPAALPSLSRSDDGAEWRFEAAVPARAIAGIRVGSGSHGVFKCTWIGSRGKRETRGALPGSGGGPQAIVSAPGDFEWLSDPAVLGVRFEDAGIETVQPLRVLPEIHVVTPRERERVPIGNGWEFFPDVSFLPPEPRSGKYRVTIEFAIGPEERPMMISEEPAPVLEERPDGVRAFDFKAREAEFVVPRSPTDAEKLRRGIVETLSMSGSRVLPISIRLEGFDPRSGSVESRSPWRICFLELKE